jgi:threonine dehydratase
MNDRILSTPPSRNDIEQAAVRVAPHVHRTPVLSSSGLNKIVGAEIFFKCENFQKVGAFKFRGATNAVQSLPQDVAARGVATHSSGNHAQALALAASLRGIKAHIVMPTNAPRVKIEAVRGYGGEIVFCEPTLAAREESLEQVIAKTGAEFIHPYNDVRIIAGQATCAKELLEEIDDLDIVMAPVGGGGLLSGTALAVTYWSSNTKVIAAEPEGADDAARSFRSDTIVPSVNPVTIADGLLTSLGSVTFPIIKKYVDDILTVSEDNIALAMRHTMERLKIVVEPSGAVPLGAILQHAKQFRGRRVGVIISGGNVDLDHLPWTKR